MANYAMISLPNKAQRQERMWVYFPVTEVSLMFFSRAWTKTGKSNIFLCFTKVPEQQIVTSLLTPVTNTSRQAVPADKVSTGSSARGYREESSRQGFSRGTERGYGTAGRRDHTWELRAQRQREGRQLLDDCKATTAVTARRKPPSTEPGGAPHAPQWGDVDVSRRGTQRHAPKRKSQKKKNQHSARRDSGRWVLFFLFDKGNAAERQEGLPPLPRAPLRWSPPWPRLQETGPDAAAAIGPQRVHAGSEGGAARLPGNLQARPNGGGLRRLEPLFGALLWKGDPPLRRWKRSIPEWVLPSRESPSRWIRSYDKT